MASALPAERRLECTFGHGTSSPMTAAEALNVVAAAQPATPRPSNPFTEDPPLGYHVRISADDYGRDPIEGELVQVDTDESRCVGTTRGLVTW